MDSPTQSVSLGVETMQPTKRQTAGNQTSKERRESSLISRNLVVGKRRTSARLEPEMWSALFDIARREHRTVHDIATLVNQNRPAGCSLTAAIRVFIMAYYRSASTEEGHARAGHGYGQVIYTQNPTVPTARPPFRR